MSITNHRANINIDIGGTFTDALIIYDKQMVFAKSPTTAYDLSVGAMQAMREASFSLEIPLEDLLESVEMIRYSTTLAMNRLIEKKGPRLGLFTTEGFEDTVAAGKGGSWGDGATIREMRNLPMMTKPELIIPRHMIVGVKERIDPSGRIVRPLDEADTLAKLRYLVNQRAHGFVICLIDSYANPIHEQKVRDLIRQQYPECYLGSMPVVLSSEVLPKWREYTRMVSTILNAYLHQSMADELRGMSEELRGLGYKKTMMMVHNSGGMAEVFRTTALNTYNGGPVAGVIGASYIGKSQGFKNIIATDMGGTSFDLGMVVEGSPRFYQFRPVIDRWAVDITMLESKSVGAGGGSLAWLNPTLGNRLEVGPKSAGSMPGPACYDLGGTEPTVTDADVVLGYINADYFHGGKMRLDRQKAVDAIKEKIANPLQVDVAEAALLIKKVVDSNMGDTIFKETVLRGYDPKDFVLFAFGGAGPTHCCGYAFRAGVPKVVTFLHTPVFCAFGSACMDVIQYYEKSKHVLLIRPITKEYLTEYEQFNETVQELQRLAIRDLEGQGIPAHSAIFSLEFDMRYGGQLNMKRIVSPRLFIQSEEDITAIYQEFEREYSEAFSPLAVYSEGGVDIETFILRATWVTPKIEIPRYPLKGTKAASEAYKGKREVFWEELGGFRPTDIYEQGLLEPGNIIEGPAIIEAASTSVVLPPGRKYAVNEYLSGIID